MNDEISQYEDFVKFFQRYFLVYGADELYSKFGLKEEDLRDAVRDKQIRIQIATHHNTTH
jgi:hypothetical protein